MNDFVVTKSTTKTTTFLFFKFICFCNFFNMIKIFFYAKSCLYSLINFRQNLSLISMSFFVITFSLKTSTFKLSIVTSIKLCFLINKRKRTSNTTLNFLFLWNTRKRYCKKYIKVLINFKLSLFTNVKKNFVWKIIAELVLWFVNIVIE